jgi:hypothetical protein
MSLIQVGLVNGAGSLETELVPAVANGQGETRLDLPHLPPPLHPVVAASDFRLLLDAYYCVRDLETNAWEFAVEIGLLNAAGLTNTQLRWLLYQGYVLQGVELTPTGARRRTFQQIANLRLTNTSSFVLTEAGAAYALEGAWQNGDGVAAERRQRPVWDETRRELRVGKVVVKRFKQPAANQQLVLRVLEEEDWPSRIDDPLPPEQEQNSMRRLNKTISNLNRGQQAMIKVHFGGGGDGQSILWRVIEIAAGGEVRAKAERV